MKPTEMARRLGVQVVRRAPLHIKGITLLAEYAPSPPTIVVYTEDLERAVAHELYHHLFRACFSARPESEAEKFAEELLGSH